MLLCAKYTEGRLSGRLARGQVNGGAEMRAWYDIESLGALYEQRDDEEGLERGAAYLRWMVKKQLGAGGVERVAVGGFSQGGATRGSSFASKIV